MSREQKHVLYKPTDLQKCVMPWHDAVLTAKKSFILSSLFQPDELVSRSTNRLL